MVEWNKSEVEDYLDWLENHASPAELQAKRCRDFVTMWLTPNPPIEVTLAPLPADKKREAD